MASLFRRVTSLLRPQENAGLAIHARRKLYIPELLYNRMVDHCKQEKPLEACGLLVGVGGQVVTAYACDNKERSPILYRVDEEQLVLVMREIRSEGHEIIGIYHSHVKTEPVPSRTDIKQANWPEAFYVIVSLAQREAQVRNWRIVDRQVTEHQLVVQKDRPGTWRDLRKAVRGTGEPARGSDIP